MELTILAGNVSTKKTEEKDVNQSNFVRNNEDKSLDQFQKRKITSSFNITDEFIEKFKAKYLSILPIEIHDQAMQLNNIKLISCLRRITKNGEEYDEFNYETLMKYILKPQVPIEPNTVKLVSIVNEKEEIPTKVKIVRRKAKTTLMPYQEEFILNYEIIYDGIEDTFLSLVPREVAGLLENLFNGYLKYVGKGWYYYNEKRLLWEDRDENLIYTEAMDLLNFFCIRFIRELNTEIKRQTKGDTAMFEVKLKAFAALKEKSGDPRFIKCVINSGRTLFYEKDFTQKLDQWNMMIPLKDGRIIDIDKGFKIRNNTKEDHISKTFATTIPKEYIIDGYLVPYRIIAIPTSALEKGIAMIDDLITKMALSPDALLDEKIRKCRKNYLLKLLGYFCTGEVFIKALFILYGPGRDNAKSTFTNLLRNIIGNDYFTTIAKETLLPGKRGKGAATADLNALEGKYLGVCSEFDSTERLSATQIKEFIGRDSLYTRRLHQEATTITSFIKILLMTNNLPTMDMDQNTSDKLRIYRLYSRFVTDPTEDLEFKADPRFDENMKKEEFRQAGLIVAMEGYRMLLQEGEVIPEDVTVQGKMFAEGNDVIGEFIQEGLIKAEGGYVPIKEILKSLLAWAKDEKYEDLYREYNKYGSITKLATELQNKKCKMSRPGNTPYLHGYIINNKYKILDI